MAELLRPQRPNILLGYDGTEENEPALCWAVEEARLRGLDLTMCYCWHWPYPEGHVDESVQVILKRAGENLLQEGARRARSLGMPGEVRTLLRREPVSETLVRESDDAELIVIGSHERHRLPAGSTAVELPARTHRPVIAVRHTGGTRGLVVAGVDGSGAADAALGFAIEEAALREAGLRVVYGTWEPGSVPDWELPLFADKHRLYEARTATLEKAVHPWRRRYPKVPVQMSVSLQRPREALLDAAADADMLVVGDRGTGGLDPLLLGATSSAMLHHAPCTVAIVPPPG
ncbi:MULTISPECIES: universal stress protein [Actinomadura]|uniref:Nucleotide-binding universal stress protein, UspA family n=1 Tax=Actinomadura madurae TaxID=1993 RepID=A0A1I5PEY8_9ACTN|nr:universal stress protein [Actinomadura madurae]SFP32682.1 Nucleotide-binding universal stress protein, UspA family [Actinomadura madurae]